MYATLFFDIEDFITPESDDIALELAGILKEEGLRGSFFVVGEKARVLKKRGRTDVIEALIEHCVGYHSNYHSIHPTTAEYLEDKGWEDGIEEVKRREASGVDAVRQIFGVNPCAWARPGASWAPQIQAGMRELGVPAVVYTYTRIPGSNLHRFAGLLSYYGWIGSFDGNYLDDRAFEEAFAEFKEELRTLQTADWTGIFCAHPTKLRARVFWDKLNFDKGQNTPRSKWRLPELHTEQEYRSALKNFRRLVQWLRDDSGLEFRTISELNALFGKPSETVSLPELLEVARKVLELREPVVTAPISPAEQVLAFAKALMHFRKEGRLPVAVEIGFVEAPRERIEKGSGASELPLDELFDALEQTLRWRKALPASCTVGLREVPLSIFYGALATVLVSTARGEKPAMLSIPPVKAYPSVASEIAEEMERSLPGWLHKPGLDPSKPVEHTLFQSWTLCAVTRVRG